MGLTFVLGRATANHSEYIMNEIKSKLRERPIGPPIIYIVPEQMTFQQEYTLFCDDDISGSMRAQVYSFSRLAWRIMSEVGGGAKQFISSTGIQMMLRKIIEERDESFYVFQRAVRKQGFIEELERVITEFKRHCISPHLLKEQIELIQHEPLTNKLSDIYYVYDKLVMLLQNQYIDGEDQLQLLAEQIAKTSLLKEAEVFIDGFHRFTPIELNVIEQLLKTCKQVTVSLTTDQYEQTSHSEFDLFYQTTDTYFKLKTVAEQNGIEINEPIFLQRIENGEKFDPAFNHLEKYFDVRPTPKYKKNNVVPIELKEAVHPRAEVEGVAQQILHLVRTKNYRFKDFVIYIRDTDTYEPLIKTLFNDFNIPVFIDEKKMMLNHPLIELVRSFLEMVETNWRYDSLFRVLKTGFINQANEIDQ